MANSVPGKIIGVRVGGVWLNCQTDATLNLTVNVSEEDPCKPDGDALTTENSIPWVERTADSRDWSIDFSAKLMRDSLASANDPADIAGLIIDGTVNAEVEFATADNQTYSDYDFVYSGSGIITNFTLNAPASGAATQDATVTGNGPLTRAVVPVAS